jgi:hypothetical protein
MRAIYVFLHKNTLMNSLYCMSLRDLDEFDFSSDAITAANGSAGRVVLYNSGVVAAMRHEQMLHAKRLDVESLNENFKRMRIKLGLPVNTAYRSFEKPPVKRLYDDYVAIVTASSDTHQKAEADAKFKRCLCTRAIAEAYLKLKHAHDNNTTFVYSPHVDQGVGPYPNNTVRKQEDCDLCKTWTMGNLDSMCSCLPLPSECMCSSLMAQFYVRNHLHLPYDCTVDYSIGPLPNGTIRSARNCRWCRPRRFVNKITWHNARSDKCVCTQESARVTRLLHMAETNIEWNPLDDLRGTVLLKSDCPACVTVNMYSPLKCPQCDDVSQDITLFVLQPTIVYWLGCDCAQVSRYDVLDLPWAADQWRDRCVAEAYCHVFQVASPDDITRDAVSNASTSHKNMMIDNIVRQNQHARLQKAILLACQTQITRTEKQMRAASRAALTSQPLRGSIHKVGLSCMLTSKHTLPLSIPKIARPRKHSLYNIKEWAIVVTSTMSASGYTHCLFFIHVTTSMALETARQWIIKHGADARTIKPHVTDLDIRSHLKEMKKRSHDPQHYVCIPTDFFIA